jgi:hypothetical protein
MEKEYFPSWYAHGRPEHFQGFDNDNITGVVVVE